MPILQNTPRGTVVSIWGKAYIRGVDGVWRPLKLGELIKPGDALLTEQNAIVQMSDGQGAPLAIGPGADAAERAIAALEQGDREAAPAAGLAGGGGGDLQPGLRVERVVESVTATGATERLDGVSFAAGVATRSDPAAADGPAGVTAPRSSIGAVEAGVPVGLGLGLPTGSGTIVVTVSQLPAIGQIIRADGTPVAVGSVLAPADLPGLVYLPPADYDGVAPVGSLQFTVSNGASSAGGGTQITLTAVNDAPLATPGSAGGAEDTLIGISLGGTDVDGTIASVRIGTLPADGTLLLADGVTTVQAGQALTPAQAAGLLFRPSANFHGSTSLSFSVTDDGGLVSSPASIAIAVTPVNDAPQAADDVVNTVGTVPITFAVLANDSDVDGDPLVVTGASVSAALGSVVVHPDGSLGFTAVGGVSGPVTISYTVADPSGATSSATLLVNVAAAPAVFVDAPALTNDSTPAIGGTTNLAPGSTVTLTVTDANGAVQTFSAVVQPDGSYSAPVPSALADGAYAVTAVVSVGAATASASDGGSIDTTAPTITVDAPALGNDATPTITGTTDLPAGSVVTLTVTGANGALHTFSATVQPGGSYSADVPGPLVDGGYSVVALGTDAAGNTGSASDSGAIDTTPPALAVDAPALTNDSTPTITGSTDLPAGSAITLVVTDALGAVQTFTAAVQAGGAYSATVPTALAEGSYSVTASASDAAGNNTSAGDAGVLDLTPPSITVDAPALTNDSTPTIAGTTDLPAGATVTLTVTDALGAVQTFGATVQAGGSYSAAVPAALAEGSYSVTASATDPAGNSASAGDSGVLDLTAPVLTVDAPALGNDSTPTITGTTDLPAGSTVALSVTDALGAVQTFSATVQAGGSYSAAVPNPLAEGGYSVNASASDAAGNSASASDNGAIDTTPPAASLTLDAVTADNIVNAGEAGGSITLTGTVGGDVQPGDTVTLVINGISYSGPVLAGNGFAIAVAGSDLLADADRRVDASVSTTDAAGNVGSASATHAYAVNTAPVAVADTLSLGEDIPAASGDVTPGTAGQDSDADGDTLTVTGVAAGALPSASGNVGAALTGTWGTLTLAADGSYSYVPAAAAQSLDAGQTVTDTFTYTIDDGRGGSASATLTISLAGADDPTTITGTFAGAVQEDAATTAIGSLAASDPDVGARGFVAQTSTGSHGSFAIDAAGQWTYTLDNAAANVQALASGQSVTETFIVAADDGTSASITVTVNGSNDAPVVSSTAISAAEEGAAVALGLAPPTDVDNGAVLTISVTGLPAIGQVQLADGTPLANGAALSAAQLAGLRYLPPADYDGSSAVGSFSYSVSDGIASVNGGTSIALAAVNDAPVAADGSAGTGENTVLNPSVPVATDVDGTVASYQLVSGPGAGNLVFNPNGSYSFDPGSAFDDLAAGATRQVSFTYTATDNDGGISAPATITITVTGTDDAPVITAGSGSVTEDAAPSASGTLSASDVDNPALAFVPGTQGGAYGSLVLNAAGAWTYTLGAAAQALADGQVVTETFTVSLTDGSTTTVTLQITGTNDGPVAVNDGSAATPVLTIAEDSGPSAPITVLANDSDVDGDALSVTAASSPHGSVAINPDHTLTFTPAPDFNGPATISYTISDGHGGTASATVFVNVTPVNDVPVAGDDHLATDEDTPLVIAPSTLTANDSDADGHALTVIAVFNAVNGSVALVGGDVVFTPAPNYNGPASFAYLVTDGFGGTTAATVNVTVGPVNDAPVAADASEGTGENAVLTGNVPAASDIDGTIAGYSLASGVGAGNGSLTFNANGSYVFDPGTDFDSLADGATRQVSFTYTAIDNSGAASAPATITIIVTGTNDGPVAVDDGSASTPALTVAEDSGPSAPIVVLANDGDVDGGTLAVIAASSPNGSVTINPDNTLTFTPAANFNGPTTIGYTVSDGQGGTSSATVFVDVTPANDAPVNALPGMQITAEDAALVFSTANGNAITVSDVDAGGSDLLSVMLTASNGTLTLGSTAGVTVSGNGGVSVTLSGTLAAINAALEGTSFQPDANFNGSAMIVVTAGDNGNRGSGGPLFDVDAIPILVLPVNDAPVAGNASAGTGENALLNASVPAATDVDGTIAGYSLVGGVGAGNGSLTFNSDGTYSFDPGSDFDSLADGATRQVSFTYTATDNSGAVSAPATVTITVTGANDAPVAQAAAFSVAEDAPIVVGTLVASDADAGAVLAFALDGAAPAGLTVDANGGYSLDPSVAAYQSLGVGQSQVLTIPYTVTDQFGASSSASLVITVTGTNDAPVAAAASFAVDEDDATVIGNVAASDIDANAVLSFALGGAAPAGLVFGADGSYSFDPGHAAYQSLADGQVQVLTVPYTVTDQHGASSSANFVITITGVNDAAVVTGVAAGSVTEDGTLLATGNLSATDVDGPASFNAASVAGTYGNFAIDAAGQWTYTLRNGDANVQALTSSQQPTETFNVTTADGTVQQITVTVNGANEAPVATVTPASGLEDAAGIPVTLSAGDVDGSIAGFTVTALPANGTLLHGGVPVALGATIPASAGSATLSFVPAPDWNGSTSLSFIATDDEGASSPAVSQTITVTAVNDAPLAADDSTATLINTPIASIPVLANDSDVDGDALSVVSATLANPAQGTVSINPDGTLAFTPALNVSGPVLVHYTVSDPSGATSAATLTVNVGANTAPTGADTTLTLSEDGARAFGAADFGFADADIGQSLAAVRIDTLPGAGSLSFNGTPVTAGQLIPAASLGGLVFTPAPNANGSAYASFTFSVQDSAGGFDATPNTVTLDVTPVNDVPVALGDSVTTDEDQPISIPLTALLANDSDVDGDALAVISVQDALQGTVAIVGGNVVFTPNPNYHGPASFTYTVADGQGGSATATVAVTVNPVNDPAVIGGDDSGAVTEDLNVVAAHLSDSGMLTLTDVDAGESAFVAGAGTPVGAVLGALAIAADGAWTYEVANADVQYLAAGQTRTEAFTVRSIDGTTHTITVTITGTNDGPVAVVDTGAVAENATLTVMASSGVLANDTDVDSGDTRAVSALSFGATAGTVGSALDGTYGTLTLHADGSYAYVANRPAAEALAAGQIVTESFSYTVRDAAGATSTATLTITVTGTDDVPTITGPLAGSVTEDTTLTSSGMLTVVDPDAGQSSWVAQSGVAGSYGSFSISAAGVWSYTLDNGAANVQSLPLGASATDSFVVTTADGTTRTVVITVNGTNDGPVAIGSSFTVAEDAAVVNGSVSATDVDTGASLSYALNGAAPAGLTFNADGSYSFDPAVAAYQALGVGQSTVLTVPFTATDAQGAGSTAHLVITVTGTNDAPVAVADAGAVAEDATLNVAAAGGVLANDTDIDSGDSAAVSAVSFGATPGTVGAALAGTYGTLTLHADGSYSYAADRPAADALAAGQIATESFSYTMRDAAGAASSATITFTVTGTDDVPTITGPLSGSVTEDTTLTASGSLLVSDPDAGQSSFVAQSGVSGSYGSFSIDAAGAWTYTLANAAANVQSLPAGAIVTDSFTVTTVDGTTRTVVVTVNGTNDGPVAVADSGALNENATLTTTAAGGVLANDSDVDAGDTRAVSAVSFGATVGSVGGALDGTYGTLTLNADGSYSYAASRPAAEALTAGQIVTESFSYTMRDAAGATSTAILTFTITGTNDVPTITGSLAGSVTEDATLTSSGTLTVADPDAGQSSWVAQSGVAGSYGSFSISAAGAWSYTLNNGAANVQSLPAGAVVADSFTVTTADGTTRTVVITVNGTNDGPVAVGSSFSVAEDAAVVNGAVSATDVDTGAVLTYALTGAAPAGLTFNANGSYSFDPANTAYQSLGVGQSTVITVPFRATDAQGASSVANLVITVTGTNDAPVAVANVATAVEAGGVANGTAGTNPTGNVLANDTDVDSGDTRSVSAVSGSAAGTVGGSTAGSYGTLVLNADGSYGYTLDNSLAAVQALRTSANTLTDTFTYTVRDASGATSSTTLTVTIQGANDAPVAVADSGALNENATLTRTAATGVLANDTDVDAGDTRTVSAVSFGATSGSVGAALNGTYGTLTLNADGSYSYSANRPAAEALAPGQVVTESFTYTMRDTAGASSAASITFTITGQNDAPVISSNGGGATATVSVAENTTAVTTVTATDVDAGQTLSYSIVGGADAARFTIHPTTGVLSFVSAPNFEAPTDANGDNVYLVQVQVSDGNGGVDLQTISVGVTNVNEAPVAANASVSTNEDVVLNGNLPAATDPDGNPVTYALAGAASSGSVVVNANGSYSYTPNAHFSGGDSFSYTVSDGLGGSNTYTVTVNVAAVADAPLLSLPSLIASVVQGGQTISTEPGITQANLEATFGLSGGVLDGFDPPAGSSTSDPGNIDVIDGKGAQYNLSLGTGNTASFAWQFFNGEDTTSEINGGYNDLVVLVVTDPSGARQYVQVTSSEQTGRNTNGATADATGTYNFTATTAGDYSFSWLVLNGRDSGKDSSLAIAAPTVTIGGTTYGQPIAFAAPAVLVDRDGSEALSVTVSGLPAGAAFSSGTALGGGAWSFTPAELVGLQLLPPAGYTGTMNLSVTATSTEASNGSTASTTQAVQVTVTATTSSTTGSQNADTINGTGADDALQGFGGNDSLSGGNGIDLLYGGDGNDTLDGGAGNDMLYGGAGNDTLSGGNGNDRLVGGAGNDSLTGGAGADVFEWRFADRGTGGSPAIDTVADFDSASAGGGGDILDLRDLLQGEATSATLDRYLDFSVSGGTTTIRISASGAFSGGTYAAGSEDQRIVLTGVDIRASLGLAGGATDAQIISELINRGKLLTDVPAGS